MAKMVSLKRTPSEQKGKNILGPEDSEVFPVDMFVYNQEVDKLGLSSAQVGEDMTLVATVRVTSVSSNERAGGKKSQNVTLSVREASVGPKVKKDRKNSEVLFGDD